MRKLYMTSLLLGSVALMAPEGLATAAKAPEPAPEALMGLTGKTTMVHKRDAEGVLLIDANTGQVLPTQHDRPEWAEGLILAQLAERHTFYVQRLGDQYAAAHKAPDMLAYEDLTWLATREGADEEPEEFILDADDEFRMEIIAAVQGLNRDPDADEGTNMGKGVIMEADIAYDNTRTGEQMAAFTASQEERFEDARKQAGTAA